MEARPKNDEWCTSFCHNYFYRQLPWWQRIQCCLSPCAPGNRTPFLRDRKQPRFSGKTVTLVPGGLRNRGSEVQFCEVENNPGFPGKPWGVSRIGGLQTNFASLGTTLVFRSQKLGVCGLILRAREHPRFSGRTGGDLKVTIIGGLQTNLNVNSA